MFEQLCNEEIVADLTFDNSAPALSGSQVIEKDEKLESICHEKVFEKAITLPQSWHFYDAVKICKILGDSRIFSFPNPGNLTGVNLSLIFGKGVSDLDFMWTPYTDIEEEGVFENVYTKEILDLDWGTNQPNGGLSQNFVNLRIEDRKFNDDTEHGDGTTHLACSYPSRQLILRGGCTKTLLGNHLANKVEANLEFPPEDRQYYVTMINGELTFVGFENTMIRFLI